MEHLIGTSRHCCRDRRRFFSTARLVSLLVMFNLLGLSGGCNSLLNGWLDPTVVGSFGRNRTIEIRTSLSLEDTPAGIPGAEYPAPIDRLLIIEEYPISAGDTLQVEINELRQRDLPFLSQVQVTPMGYVNLPVVGRVRADGMTVPQFEDVLASALIKRGHLLEPQVTVNAVFQHKATFSIFGIGASASNNAPLRAGTFPIRRPDTRLLEAINQVGGLSEFVTDVYVFRTYQPPVDYDPWGGDDESLPSDIGTVSSSAEPTEPMREPHLRSSEFPPALSDEVPPTEHKSPAESETPFAEEQAILDAVLENDGAAAEDSAENIGGRTPAEGEVPFAGGRQDQLLQELEPDPTDPLIWVDGQFVPNTTYKPPAPEPAPAVSEPLPGTDTVTPSARWARIAGDSSFRILRILGDSLRAGDPEANIYVRPGDVIRIVSGEIGIYYVMGQVNRVGPFRFNAETVTLKGAIATAGGLSPLAWPDRCTVYRRLGQREQMIQVNLDRIFAGLDPDFDIRRGDIINVGTHPFAPFLQRIRALSLPNPVSNVGYGFTYVRNFADVDSFAVRRNPHNEPDRFPNLFP